MDSPVSWRSGRSWRGGDWRPPETEEECLEYYQGKINNGQNKELLPLQEDLADWINKTLGIELKSRYVRRLKRKGFLFCIVTGDEKWVYYRNPEWMAVPNVCPNPPTNRVRYLGL
ncbi:hypothetical protein AAG570_007588 [Ranatra chinensis]|uniref:Uncharacterized protein n=1 Tax=Ranatra chinensis TaxID=642074 RepID=A0ABD0YFS0_9HEMI